VGGVEEGDEVMRIEVKVGRIERVYHVYRTDAPASYDGFGTIEVWKMLMAGKLSRVVMVDERHEEWQKGRYRSGMHEVDPEYATALHEIESTMFERMVKGILGD
jgi:hypothetical protein